MGGGQSSAEKRGGCAATGGRRCGESTEARRSKGLKSDALARERCESEHLHQDHLEPEQEIPTATDESNPLGGVEERTDHDEDTAASRAKRLSVGFSEAAGRGEANSCGEVNS